MRGKSSLAQARELAGEAPPFDEVSHTPDSSIGEVEDDVGMRDETDANVWARRSGEPAQLHEPSILRSRLRSQPPNLVQLPWRPLTVDDVAATLRPVQQLDGVDGCIGPAGAHAVLRPCGAEAARLGISVERAGDGRRTRLVGISDAGGARDDGGRTWLHFRDDAHCVDRRRLDLPLQRRLHDRTVPGDEGFDCGVVFGQTSATRTHRVLLRRIPGRHRRWWRTSRNCRIVSHWAGLQPVSSSDAVSRR